MSNPPANWYPDPSGKPGLVYWDGEQWHPDKVAPASPAASPLSPTSARGIGRRTKIALVVGAVALAAAIAAGFVVPGLLKHRPAGSSSTSAARTYGPQTVLPFTGIDRPAGIAVDKAGNVYIASVYNSKIWKLAAGSSSATAVPFDGLGLPESVAADNDGNVYVADESHRVLKVAPGSSSPTVLMTLKGPEGVAVDSAGTVYVTDFDIPGGGGAATSQVYKLASGSIVPAALPFTGLGNVPYTEGVAVDGSGNIYVADAKNQRILKLALAASTPTVLPFTGIYPTSVAVDNAGNLYFTDGKTPQVFELPAGAANPFKLPFTGLTSLVGVAVDGAGNVYVADESGHHASADRVVKLPAQ
jgi:serine/threonine-protein kinase